MHTAEIAGSNLRILGITGALLKLGAMRDGGPAKAIMPAEIQESAAGPLRETL